MTKQIAKWTVFPALLIVSVLSGLTTRHQFTIDAAMCVCTLAAVLRALWLREPVWAAGFIAAAVVFSPLLLIAKIFVLMGLGCCATFGTFAAACTGQFRPAAAPQSVA